MKVLTASAALFILFLSLSVSAQTFPQPQDKYVNDFAGFLDSASVSQLRGLLSELKQNTTAEIVVVTVQTTEPEPPDQYRTELFNNWKIGKAANDNGLLILYAVKENRIEVETGYGLEGILTDSKVGSILDEFYVPNRDSNRTALGIILATQEFARVINANADEVRAGNAGSQFNNNISNLVYGNLPFVILAIIFLVSIIPSLSIIPPKCSICGKRMKFQKTEGDYDIYKCQNGHQLKKRKRKYGGVLVAGGFGRGGGGWGGGGGGEFGGGGSGGGGAGR